MGGIAGTIDPSFTQSSMVIDYVRVYQNVQVDAQAPTNFTASVGAVTSSSVELSLNANDDSGTVVYEVTYGSITNQFTGLSGVQKSVVLSGLNPSTSYSFSVVARDVTGNTAVNNAIVLNATTLGVTGCSGTDTVAQQGAFSTGYNYSFETIGTDVKITFELLDTDKVGVVAYLWKQSPFTETSMTNVSGNIFTKTITGQTLGSTINYAVKFAYANGLSVTRYVPYVVGSNCSLNATSFNDFSDFTMVNPAHDFLEIMSNESIDLVEVYTLIGTKVLETQLNTSRIDISNLSKGIYMVTIYSGSKKAVRKVIIQ